MPREAQHDRLHRSAAEGQEGMPRKAQHDRLHRSAAEGQEGMPRKAQHDRLRNAGSGRHSMSTVAERTPARKARGSGGVRGWFGRLPWPIRAVIIVVLAVLVYLLPYAGQVPVIGPQIVTQGIDWPSALFNMSYYVLLSLGLNVVVGYAGLLDLGYVGFFAVGAYAAALLTSPDSVLRTDWPWLASIPVALAVTMVAGLVLGWPTLRLRGDY